MMYKVMRYFGMFGVIVLLTIIKALIDGLMNWKTGGGGIPAALYTMCAISVFMMIFMMKDTENGQRNFKICKYTSFVSGIIFFILCYQAENRQAAPKSIAITQNQEQIEEYNKAFKKKLGQDHPELSALNAEEQNALMEDMKKWIEEKPYKEAKELLKIYESGNAEQVSWLMSYYKKLQVVSIPKIAIALPFPGRSYALGEQVKQNGFWYSYVTRHSKGNLFYCETNAGFLDDNLPIRLFVVPQIFHTGDVLSMDIPKSKIDTNTKKGEAVINFGDGVKISALYSVESYENQDDACYIVVKYYNAKNIIDLMMKRNSMNIALEGQNVSFNFSLVGFTASFKRILKLTQELK